MAHSQEIDMTRFLILPAFVLALGVGADSAAQRRPVAVDDQFRFQDVGNPELSPDGEWIVYSVTTTDVAADRRNTDLWKVKWDGSSRSQLTFSPESETSPKWSPDGKYISFLSSRPRARRFGCSTSQAAKRVS
jgi:Tol biopolymer transport system component